MGDGESHKIGKTLRKWYEAKKHIEELEEKINKYRTEITREMNQLSIDKISKDGFTVTRRRNTRSTLSKGNVPNTIWEQYSTKSHYDSYSLIRN